MEVINKARQNHSTNKQNGPKVTEFRVNIQRSVIHPTIMEAAYGYECWTIIFFKQVHSSSLLPVTTMSMLAVWPLPMCSYRRHHPKINYNALSFILNCIRTLKRLNRFRRNIVKSSAFLYILVGKLQMILAIKDQSITSSLL